VLLKALPGLLDHDRGLRARSREEADRFFGSAFTVLDDSVQTAPPAHPVVTYVRLAQVASCRAWQAKLFALLSTDDAREARKPVQKKFKSVLDQLKAQWQSDADLKATLKKFNDNMVAGYLFD
jgi:hypothetical protein